MDANSTLLKTLARAYCAIDQKWKDEKSPIAVIDTLICKEEILKDLECEILKLKPELSASQKEV